MSGTEHSPEDYAEYLDRALRRIEELGQPPDAFKLQMLVDDVMHSHYGLEVSCAAAGLPRPAPSERVANLPDLGDALNMYLSRVGLDAEKPLEHGMEDIAQRRSAAAFAAQAFGDHLFRDDLVEEIDDEILSALERVGPPDEIPPGIPESHWWWRALPQRLSD